MKKAESKPAFAKRDFAKTPNKVANTVPKADTAQKVPNTGAPESQKPQSAVESSQYKSDFEEEPVDSIQESI